MKTLALIVLLFTIATSAFAFPIYISSSGTDWNTVVEDLKELFSFSQRTIHILWICGIIIIGLDLFIVLFVLVGTLKQKHLNSWMKEEKRGFDETSLGSKTLLTDEEVEVLIRIADGGETKTYEKGWRTLWLTMEHRHYAYNLDAQLEAIERLGRSSNLKALVYVEKLSEYVDGGYTEGGSCSDADEHNVDYPNAKGELRSALGWSSPSTAGVREWSQDWGKSQDLRASSVLEKALSHLRKDFGK